MNCTRILPTLILMAAGALSLLAGPINAQTKSDSRRENGGAAPVEQATAPVKTHSNLRYAENPGVAAEFNSLDVYAPADAERRPVMVYIHGGSWNKGDKGFVGSKATYFTGKGWLLVSVNYRLSPAARHPAHVQDVAAALAWVHKNIATYGGDPEKMFIMGHSAGGHLAALVATNERYLKAQGCGLEIIKGVVGLDGAGYTLFDMGKMIDQAPASSVQVYQDAFGENPATWESASPKDHVASGKGIPPFLLVRAGDSVNPAPFVKSFAGALQAAGVRAEIIDFSGAKDHMSINREFGQAGDKPTQEVMAFLKSLN